MKEVYISVDVEADGPYPGDYSMLSLGAVVVGDHTKRFYSELQPISTNFVPDAAKVTGLDRLKLERSAPHPGVVVSSFVEWVRILGGKPVCCTFSTWDWVFLYYYLMRFKGRSPFGHSSLDMKSYAAGKYGLSWRGTGKSAIKKERPELLEGLPPHTHNALDDAIEQAELFRRMRDGA